MAGNYPDVPGHRMAYDRDGSIVFERNSSNVVTEWTTARKQTINDHDPNSGSEQANDGGLFGIVFPEPRDVVGIYMRSGDGAESAPSHAWSTNTTNGIDGTWTAFSMTRHTSAGTVEDMRNLISAQSFTGCKGIRHNRGGLSSFGSRRIIRSYHIYGAPAEGAAPGRLRVWHPTLDQGVDGAWFDWGDSPRNAVQTRDFRLRNPSAQTANDLTLTVEALTDSTPSMVGQHAFSIDGGASYSYPLNIGNLPPGAVSPVVTVRRVVPGGAALSLGWARLVASASSWT